MMMIMMKMTVNVMCQVNDSSMALLGGAQGDEYRQIVELVVSKMEVYCRKASPSTTIRSLPLSPSTITNASKSVLLLRLLLL